LSSAARLGASRARVLLFAAAGVSRLRAALWLRAARLGLGAALGLRAALGLGAAFRFFTAGFRAFRAGVLLLAAARVSRFGAAFGFRAARLGSSTASRAVSLSKRLIISKVSLHFLQSLNLRCDNSFHLSKFLQVGSLNLALYLNGIGIGHECGKYEKRSSHCFCNYLFKLLLSAYIPCYRLRKSY
jgi:hypothetical protein